MVLSTARTDSRAVTRAITPIAAGTARSQGSSAGLSARGGRNGTASTPANCSQPAARNMIKAKPAPTAAANSAERK